VIFKVLTTQFLENEVYWKIQPVKWYIFTHVSEDLASFIFKVINLHLQDIPNFLQIETA
jgi:hypothetical protein